MSPPRTPFEANLRRLMERAEIPTYSKLSARSGIAINVLNAICAGRHTPSLQTARALINTLGCTLDEFLDYPTTS